MTGPLLPYSDALAAILAHSPVPRTESVGVELLSDRVLASEVFSRIDSPAFDNSAVDGFGCKAGSDGGRLVAEVKAGDSPDFILTEGEVCSISTGAMIPDGVDAVVMMEHAVREGDSVSFAPVQGGDNIRRQGEEYRAGTALLPAGTLLKPPHVALAAGSGHDTFTVYSRPRVAILSTGSELVAPGRELRPGQVYGSNPFGLSAAVQALGCEPPLRVHAKDDEETTCSALAELLSSADVVLTTGGVSVGEHDHVKTACERCGVREVFWGVAIKPGQPLYFGVRGEQLVFGLPGNPVSALVCYFLFVRPALLRLIGLEAAPPIESVLEETIGKSRGRAEFVRGELRSEAAGYRVRPISARGSHMMGGLSAADCLIHCPAEVTQVEAGSKVEVHRLTWGAD